MTRTMGWTITAALLGMVACSSGTGGGDGASTATAQPESSGPLGSKWSDVTKLPDFFSGLWQSASPMMDGPVKVGYTEQAKAYIAKYKPKRDIPLAGATCKPAGLPISQRASSPLKFMFEPGMISIYLEQASMTRFIRLNAEHSEAPDPSYFGESVARFEGDTLVVDSIGFRDDIVFQYGAAAGSRSPQEFMGKVIFGPHGPNLRMVERMRLLDKDTLEIKLTIYDDTVFTEPYESQPVQIFKRITGEAAWPGEWQCETSIANAYNPEEDRAISLEPEEMLKQLEDQKLVK